jgi:hypothetical protein
LVRRGRIECLESKTILGDSILDEHSLGFRQLSRKQPGISAQIRLQRPDPSDTRIDIHVITSLARSLSGNVSDETPVPSRRVPIRREELSIAKRAKDRALVRPMKPAL